MPRDFKTILCPTDFSDDSFRAIDYGKRFAQMADGTLLLAHIIHVPTEHLYDEGGHLRTFDQLKRHGQEQLERARADRLADHPRCELLLEIGNPFEALMKIATDRKVDLMITSTHGRTGIQHLVMGSVAEKIIRHAPCPVFVVRRGME